MNDFDKFCSHNNFAVEVFALLSKRKKHSTSSRNCVVT